MVSRLVRVQEAAGSNPATPTNSEIPVTVSFPPNGENCTLVEISSLPAGVALWAALPRFEFCIFFVNEIKTD